MEVKIEHNLSFNGIDNVANKIRIFKEIKRANRIFYSKNKLKKSLVTLNNLVVSIKLSARFKTLAFLYDWKF